MPYTVIIHSSRAHAVVSSLNGAPSFVARFARDETGEWTRTGITWLGPQPSVEERHAVIASARRALMLKLRLAGVPVNE